MLRNREFTAPNGVKRTFWFRDGTNDEATIIACFEEDHYKIMDENLKQGDVVIDLGAHIGGVTCLLATIPGIKVVSVEALPENAGILRLNLEQADNSAEVSVYERAIWSRSGKKINIRYGDNSESGKVHRFIGTIGQAIATQDNLEVETISLCGIFRKEHIDNCRLLKVDIEGAENEAIGGAPKHILKKIEKIKGENHGGNYHQLFDKVGDIFEEISDINEGTVLCDFEWRRKNAK